MAKVLLIQPQVRNHVLDSAFSFEPLALEYLGAGLKQAGHTARIFDGRLESGIEEVLQEYRPTVVGITGFTTHLNVMKEYAALAKWIDPAIRVVVGGHHATVRPADFNDAAVDFVVIGEGVNTLVELVEAIKSGGDAKAILGLGIPDPEGMRFTPPRPQTPLDDLPFPDRSLTSQHRNRYFSEWYRPLASIRTSLGCTARCTFCALWSLTGGKYLRREPEKIVEELKTIEEPYVFFSDDESMVDVKRMEHLADLIAKSGIRKKYFISARVDTIARHPELFAKWKRIGLCQIFVGMEDFSDRRLAAINKKINTEQQAKAVTILEDLGIIMYASFMVHPDYDREDFGKLKDYVRKLKLRYATFSIMTPLPGTTLHEQVKEQVVSHKPELYDMLHALVPTRLPLPEFYGEMAKLYQTAIPRHRLLPSLLRFGLHGMWLRLRLMGKFLEKIRYGHLDYEPEGENLTTPDPS